MHYCVWHTSVTPKVFKFIGPSIDSRRHGRGTYLFFFEFGDKFSTFRSQDSCERLLIFMKVDIRVKGLETREKRLDRLHHYQRYQLCGQLVWNFRVTTRVRTSLLLLSVAVAAAAAR
jgi:hypothetical protein